MKVKKLKLKNIGLIADETITLDKPLICLYGEVRQGKSTFLNSVRWVCGGSFPSDIIRHGEKEAIVEMEGDNWMVSRSWYRGKDGTTKARDVQFIRNGKPVDKPVRELERFLNPFLLNQDYLRNMTEQERKKYFAEMFAVDTADLDNEAFRLSCECETLRATIKGYGDIDLTEVKPVDAAELRRQIDNAKAANEILTAEWESACELVRSKYSKDCLQATGTNFKAQSINDERVNRSKIIAELKNQIKGHEAWLEANPERAMTPHPVSPSIPEKPTLIDNSRLEIRLQEAAAANVRHEQYQRNRARAEARTKEEEALASKEKRQREIKVEKIAKLKGITDSCPIKELRFDESGNFTYQGTEAGMLSTSQIMALSSELSALYPDGLSLELLDRGESLGKSIFEFVDRAKREEKTILATIVGERPAETPPEVGVFVVANGKLLAEERV